LEKLTVMMRAIVEVEVEMEMEMEVKVKVEKMLH
jgi:hypothetical protein